jgi:hypothetical protein
MEAVRTSETSVDNHFTRQYNPEDSSEHHTRRRENLKSHNILWAHLFLYVALFTTLTPDVPLLGPSVAQNRSKGSHCCALILWPKVVLVQDGPKTIFGRLAHSPAITLLQD